MSTPAPELPRRTPGLVGNEFEPLARPDVPSCFECDRPAVFELAVMEQTPSGGSLGRAFRLCELCVGQTAAAIPEDRVVLITRLPKETTKP